MAVASGIETGLVPDNQAVRKFIQGSAIFWNKRAQKHGAFEEYYPWEQGYPPLAFSTLAMAQLAERGWVTVESIQSGLEIAARQLKSRFEGRAANQQVAGLAAAILIADLLPGSISSKELEILTSNTLSLQNEEGWFEEYGGPDIGYLAVTIDCLLDGFDCNQDKRLLSAAIRAAKFISSVTACGRVHMGMHNARNTDYVVPYGLTRLALEYAAEWSDGNATIANLFSHCHETTHPLAATDDRYLCHYIGKSILRCVRFLQSNPFAYVESEPVSTPRMQIFENSGHVLVRLNDGYALVSLKKGGIYTANVGQKHEANFGLLLHYNGACHITHWWSDEWKWKRVSAENEETEFVIRGPFFVHKETESSPAKHMLLRAISLILGRGIISRLKARLIFKRRKSPYRLERYLRISDDSIEAHDKVIGPNGAMEASKAPRMSKRHVASADSYHHEDFL